MISVVIPTHDDERALLGTLASLVSAAADGSVREVIVADAGSTDGTRLVADTAGCHVVVQAGERAVRMDRAAASAKGPWLLFLLPGAELDEGWFREVRTVVDLLERRGESRRRAAVFRFAVDAFGTAARLAELRARLRALMVAPPLGGQGLLIHSAFYAELGGFRALPGMEDVDLLRRIGQRRLLRMRARLLLRPEELVRTHMPGAGLRRLFGLSLLALRVPPSLVSRLYA